MGIVSFFNKLFGRRDSILPCIQSRECPYEYEKEPERDIEGMPQVKGDRRSCPEYGHICPAFMEDFGLTVEELDIRAAIHCGGLMDYFLQEGAVTKDSPEYIEVMKKYKEMKEKYPRNKYPQYY
jgi:hypothetical protein